MGCHSSEKKIIKMCLLYLLSKEEMYGYILLKKLCSVFPDIQESTMYVILRELCSSGYIKYYIGQISGGPQRKYYQVTEDGMKLFVELLEEWRKLTESIKNFGLY